MKIEKHILTQLLFIFHLEQHFFLRADVAHSGLFGTKGNYRLHIQFIPLEETTIDQLFYADINIKRGHKRTKIHKQICKEEKDNDLKKDVMRIFTGEKVPTLCHRETHPSMFQNTYNITFQHEAKKRSLPTVHQNINFDSDTYRPIFLNVEPYIQETVKELTKKTKPSETETALFKRTNKCAHWNVFDILE